VVGIAYSDCLPLPSQTMPPVTKKMAIGISSSANIVGPLITTQQA
jgi:hypothetical protein